MPKGKLSTHVLDAAQGKPAAGLKFTLSRKEGEGMIRVLDGLTNFDGRTDAPLLAGEALSCGEYELLFYAGDYLIREKLVLSGALFLDQIPIRFHIVNTDENYHVPLLLSPFSYSTYRGS